MGGLADPTWTTRGERRGVDPLGMQNTSVSLYQRLLPGISNVTLRMRYYGLYAWLADQYARHSGSTAIEDWRKYLRRSEALYALIVQSSTQDSGVAGTRWAKHKLESTRGPWITFSEHTDDLESSERQYLLQSFGAYGAAYGTQLMELGILQTTDEHDVPVPSADVGDQLAVVFADAIGEAGAQFQAAVQRGSITKSGLESLIGMVPSAIAKGSPEREMYEGLLLGRASRQSQGDVRRRMTLRLVLRMVEGLQRSPSVEDVRWGLYSLQDPDGNSLDVLDASESAHRESWVAYHANDLCHACYEALLKYSLDILEGFPAGIALESWLTLVVESLLEELGGMASWDRLLNSVTLSKNAWADEAESEFALVHELMDGADTSGAMEVHSAAAAIKLLAVLYKRFALTLEQLDSELKAVGGGLQVQSLVTEIQFLQARANEPLDRVLHAVLRLRIIDRHLWVAIQKLHFQGDYTFLLESDNGLVRLRRKDGPVLTNPRLGSSIRFLQDIHLIGPTGLTRHGRRVVDAA